MHLFDTVNGKFFIVAILHELFVIFTVYSTKTPQGLVCLGL